MARSEASMLTNTEFKYKVKRGEVETIHPDNPSPKEPLYLSNLDDQEICHDRTGSLFIFKSSPSMMKRDPHKVVKKGLAKVLDHYYPFSGRLKKVRNGKLCVDFTEQGVPFVEAEADITLFELGELQPPFPCVKQLVYDIEESESITDTPIIVVQVTVFQCGGFIVAVKLNEVICDFRGYVQFLEAWGEMCRGKARPSVKPIWKRKILFSPRDPPRVAPHMTFHHYDPEPPHVNTAALIPMSRMCVYSCALDGRDMRVLKHHCTSENPGTHYTTFEVALAFVWRSRVRAMEMSKDQVVRMLFMVNARDRMRPPIPEGYYGSVVAMPCIKSTAGEISTATLQKVAHMIRVSKETVDDEFMRSTVDYLEIHKSAPRYPLAGTMLATDMRNMHKDISRIDFGWGSPLYGNGAFDADGVVESCHCYMMPVIGHPEKVLVTFCLPPESVSVFEDEYQRAFSRPPNLPSVDIRSRI